MTKLFVMDAGPCACQDRQADAHIRWQSRITVKGEYEKSLRCNDPNAGFVLFQLSSGPGYKLSTHCCHRARKPNPRQSVSGIMPSPLWQFERLRNRAEAIRHPKLRLQ